MSYYRFFASDQEMPEFDNGKAQKLIIDGEVVAISFANGFDEDTAMRIVREDDFCCAEKFTDKKYVNYLEWYYNDENAQTIVDYVKALLADRFTVSLFNTWEGDESELLVKKVNVRDLRIEHIREIWGQKFFERNECLVVFRSC
ncbi:MAG: hypothetical protein LUF34_02585 [Lachnospiraceae bacterium]|nr:hypothetical protein [Lachnospiraceae bacterium]